MVPNMAAVLDFVLFGINAAQSAVVKIAAQKDPIVFESKTYRFNLSLC